MRVIIKQSGNFNNTEKFLKRAKNAEVSRILHEYGKKGVAALASATPIDTGLTANSWDYKIDISKGSYTITWTNSHRVDGVLIAIILQYGHGTRNGGYVQGRDYINPAMRPIFDNIAEDIWREVTAL